jgi:hypothetical protein
MYVKDKETGEDFFSFTIELNSPQEEHEFEKVLEILGVVTDVPICWPETHPENRGHPNTRAIELDVHKEDAE